MSANIIKKLLIPIFTLILSLVGSNSYGQFGGGDGSAGNPFQISTPIQLNYFSTQINGSNSNNYNTKYYKLTADIDMISVTNFSPIGRLTSKSFKGIFNGGGYTISNLTITNTTGEVNIGLFGNISGAIIENLKLDSANITAKEDKCKVGSLVGYAEDGSKIINCSVINSTVKGYEESRIGGLVGDVKASEISQCYATNSYTSGTEKSYIGGLIGSLRSESNVNASFVTDSEIKGEKNIGGGGESKESSLGGLIGYVRDNGTTVDNCFARGNIVADKSDKNKFGGLVGTNKGTISNSYAAPTHVMPTNNKEVKQGILVGNNSSGSIENSFYDNTYDITTMNKEGTGKDSTFMKSQALMDSLNHNNPNPIWGHNTSINNEYPTLTWYENTVLWDGIGTKDSPFRIRYAKDLIRLSNLVVAGSTFEDKYLVVENNISFTDSSHLFSPIGTATLDQWGSINNIYPFQGNFNGQGHIISNLTMDSEYNFIGLFGYTSYAKIDSIGIDNTCSFNCPAININSQTFYGGTLIGYSHSSVINSTYTSGKITGNGNKWKIGGLIGGSYQDTINNCYSRAKLFHIGQQDFWETFYGGLIGKIFNENIFSITNSYSAPVEIPKGHWPASPSGNTGILIGNKFTPNANQVNNTYYQKNEYWHVNQWVDYMISHIGIPKDIEDMKTIEFVNLLNGTQTPLPWKSDTDNINDKLAILGWQTEIVIPPTTRIIRTVQELINFSNSVNGGNNYSGKTIELGNDIIFNNCSIDSSSNFIPIGDFTNNKGFSGIFDGKGFGIANYKFINGAKDNIGIFAYTKDATIKNLGISNINITAKNNIGGLVANADNTNIENCFVYGHIKGLSNVGGLVGDEIDAGSSIDNSFSNVTIDAQTNVGGIVGQHRGTILNVYSNAEIYSSTTPNDYVGGIIGRAYSGSVNNVYAVSKIVRNGTSTNFGKIKGNTAGSHSNSTSFSRDNVFVNCDNASLSGFDGTSATNAILRNPNTPGNLGAPAIWRADYTNNINDGYPIFTYQTEAIRPASSGAWPSTTASQIVIIQNGVQLKTSTANCPKSAYVKIETGGELNNTTNLSMFGEYNRELFVGKWNMIGLSTNNLSLASLINYNDIPYKTFVKRFDYATNNWQASTNANTNTITNINTQFKQGEGVLVMPNYSLDAQYANNIKSKIISKGVLYNNENLDYSFNNTSLSTKKFVALANNYPASIKVTQANPPISGNAGLIQGNLVYVYDADSGKWNNNLQTTTGAITKIKPSEGFFIATNTANSIFHFNKSQINNTSGAKNIIKSNLIYITANTDNETRQAFLEYSFDADNDFDFQDGLMMFGTNPNSVEPYLISTTQQLNKSINEERSELIKDAFSSLPYTTELDLRSYDNNEVNLNFSNIPDDIHVYLIDSLLNQAQYLNEEPNYNLQVNAGDNAKRLYVMFSYFKEDINEFFKPEMPQEIRIWNYNNVMNIEGKDLIRYEIYDVIGNKLLEQEVFNDDFQTQLSLNNGIYIVRAYSKTGSKTEKLKISN